LGLSQLCVRVPDDLDHRVNVHCTTTEVAKGRFVTEAIDEALHSVPTTTGDADAARDDRVLCVTLPAALMEALEAAADRAGVEVEALAARILEAGL
jgi:hypothetical protein